MEENTCKEGVSLYDKNERVFIMHFYALNDSSEMKMISDTVEKVGQRYY